MSTMQLSSSGNRPARRAVRRAADQSFLAAERARPDDGVTRPAMSNAERGAVVVLWAFLVAFVVVEVGSIFG